jgi:hypothetical protein
VPPPDQNPHWFSPQVWPASTALGPDPAHVEIPAYPGEVADVAGVLTAALGACPALTSQALTRALVLTSLTARGRPCATKPTSG